MADQSFGVGSDFDPIRLASGILETVANYSSDIGSIPNLLVISPEEVGTGQAGEDRMNCFLRLIGFPAIRDEAKIDASRNEQNISGGKTTFLSYVGQSQTLNYVRRSDFGAGFSSALTAVDERGQLLRQKQTPAAYTEMISGPLDVDASISDLGRKAQIVPPVVDAAIPVFPIAKRVAPIFFSGDFLTPDGRSRLSRPFIEHIIYMRMKVFSGAKSELVEQISKLIEKETGDAELAADLPSQFTKIEQLIVEKFIQAIRQSAQKYAAVVAKAKLLASQVAFEVAPVSNPEQRSITPLSSNPEIGITTTSIGAKIQKINEALAEQQSLMISLPTESISRDDRIRRIEDEIVLTNVRADVFVSEFVDLLGFERKSLEAELETAKAEERAKIMELEQVKRDLLFYTGEFTGLSIFDVLCVLYALFTVELKYVIGLLNKSAQDRLKSDKYFKTNQAGDSVQQTSSASNLIDATATMAESIDAVSGQIINAFKLARFFADEARTGLR